MSGPLRKRLPRLPSVVQGLAGPIPVERVIELKDWDETTARDVACDGLWIPNQRRIQLDTSLELAPAWQALFHEEAHSWFDDLGIKMPGKLLESVCEAVATARMAELWRQK